MEIYTTYGLIKYQQTNKTILMCFKHSDKGATIGGTSLTNYPCCPLTQSI